MLTTTKENLKELYEKDFLLWIEKTVKLLSDRQLQELDYDNLIEELETLGNEQKRAVESLLEQIIRHLLLYQYWTAEFQYNGHHWEAEIISFRNQIKRRLTTNLRRHLSQELTSIYQDAWRFIKVKTKLSSLPHKCPYSLDQILDENWLPPISNQ